MHPLQTSLTDLNCARRCAGNDTPQRTRLLLRRLFLLIVRHFSWPYGLSDLQWRQKATKMRKVVFPNAKLHAKSVGACSAQAMTHPEPSMPSIPGQKSAGSPGLSADFKLSKRFAPPLFRSQLCAVFERRALRKTFRHKDVAYQNLVGHSFNSFSGHQYMHTKEVLKLMP